MQPGGGDRRAPLADVDIRCRAADGHLQRPDRQIPLHAVAYGPADNPPRMQVQDHSQIQPPLAGPDVADITRPFLVRPGRREVAIQQVRCDVELMIAVGVSSGK